MLWAIGIILLVLWALGLASGYTMGGVIHALLVIALTVVAVQEYRVEDESIEGKTSEKEVMSTKVDAGLHNNAGCKEMKNLS